jgi:hypothetical protein
LKVEFGPSLGQIAGSSCVSSLSCVFELCVVLEAVSTFLYLSATQFYYFKQGFLQFKRESSLKERVLRSTMQPWSSGDRERNKTFWRVDGFVGAISYVRMRPKLWLPIDRFRVRAIPLAHDIPHSVRPTLSRWLCQVPGSTTRHINPLHTFYYFH